MFDTTVHRVHQCPNNTCGINGNTSMYLDGSLYLTQYELLLHTSFTLMSDHALGSEYLGNFKDIYH